LNSRLVMVTTVKEHLQSDCSYVTTLLQMVQDQKAR
jgi:hypothetical protein